MSTTPAFSTQLIGQTEKTLNAILGRLLAPTGLTEPQWVTLTVAVAERWRDRSPRIRQPHRGLPEDR